MRRRESAWMRTISRKFISPPIENDQSRCPGVTANQEQSPAIPRPFGIQIAMDMRQPLYYKEVTPLKAFKRLFPPETPRFVSGKFPKMLRFRLPALLLAATCCFAGRILAQTVGPNIPSFPG